MNESVVVASVNGQEYMTYDKFESMNISAINIQINLTKYIFMKIRDSSVHG